MILLIATPDDEHALAVAKRLEERSAAHEIISPGHIYESALYAINPSEIAPLSSLILQGRVVDLSRLKAVYWRRTKTREESLTLNYPDKSQIATAEAHRAVVDALRGLPPAFFPLGHPDTIDHANKLAHLRTARQVGLRTPEALVTNDPAALRSFLQRHERVAVKPLHHGLVHDVSDRSKIETLLWCRAFDSEKLRAMLEGTERCQLFVQQLILKRAEWRITVLPHATIACEIDTTSLPADEPDWRKRSQELPHRIFKLPAGFDRKLRKFLTAHRLPAGYFDFGVPVEGDPVFFECNTNAQWLWIEQRTGCQISSEIAHALTANAPHS